MEAGAGQDGGLREPLAKSSGGLRRSSGDGAAGKPVARQNILTQVCIFILIMELAERLCFYSFSGSITFFLRDNLGFSQAVASAQASVFNTLVYLTPLLGGFIADAYWGRYRTIAVFGTIYLLGTSLMAYAAHPAHLNKGLFMFAFFGLVSLGAGGIKSNVITMGGDQFNLDIPEESAQKESCVSKGSRGGNRRLPRSRLSPMAPLLLQIGDSPR